MPSRINLLWCGVLIIIASRLIAMAIVPLMDTSEPRYAEIARIMLETGDWITPYFNYGEPFWGKPPLAFWAMALSFKLLGVNEFAARLPSLLVTLALLWLLHLLAKQLLPSRSAPLPLLIYAGMALSFIASGAVLTDPFLALGMMLSMTSFYMVVNAEMPRPRVHWSHLFFTGLAISLLAKGPVVLVLTFGPLVLWMALQRNFYTVVKRFHWLWGMAIVILVSFPWYIAAEMKTPGFLDYFIVGEHIKRFLEPGWSGDLYGSAHIRPRGTIWLYGILAAFPWSVILLISFAGRLAGKHRLYGTRAALVDATNSYLLVWMLFPLVFFTVARNILWTYVLPALPAFSLLAALYITRDTGHAAAAKQRAHLAVALVMPVLLMMYTAYTTVNGGKLKTEKGLIESYYARAGTHDPLVYVENRPFSARYYSSGTAKLLSLADLEGMCALNEDVRNNCVEYDSDVLANLGAKPGSTLYIAIPNGSVSSLDKSIRSRLRYEFTNRRFALYSVPTQQLEVDQRASSTKTGVALIPAP